MESAGQQGVKPLASPELNPCVLLLLLPLIYIYKLHPFCQQFGAYRSK